METSDFDKYISLVKKIINDTFDNKTSILTIFDIITITMGVVEEINDNNHLTGKQKKKLAIDILNIIIDILIKIEKITPENASELKKTIENNGQLILQFIDTAAFLTKNPFIINKGKFIINETKNCFGKCLSCDIL